MRDHDVRDIDSIAKYFDRQISKYIWRRRFRRVASVLKELCIILMWVAGAILFTVLTFLSVLYMYLWLLELTS